MVTVPQIDMSGNALFHDMGIFSESQILDLSKKIFSTLETETMAGCKSFTWLDGGRAETFSDTLMSFGLVGGVWDKHPHRPYAVCSSLEEIKVCENILFGSKFSVWGWGETPSAAASITLEELIARARHSGVLDEAIEHKKCRKAFKDPVSTKAWILTNIFSRPFADCSDIAASDPPPPPTQRIPTKARKE